MSIKYGSINRVIPDITQDIFNNVGKHNDFVLLLNSDNHYPGKVDPVILRFDSNIKEWIYVVDKTIDNFGYATEDLLIESNTVTLNKIPLDNVIWDIFLLDENKNIIRTVERDEIYLNNGSISGLNKYIGNSICLMYCFGDRVVEEEIEVVNNDEDETYLNEEIDILEYDGPYDMNDILKGMVYPRPRSSFDSTILERIKEYDLIINRLGRRKLITTKRLLIIDNQAVLPYEVIGDIVHNMALVYDSEDLNDRVITEYTCSVDKHFLKFDEEDELDGKYCVVSYLAELC